MATFFSELIQEFSNFFMIWSIRDMAFKEGSSVCLTKEEDDDE